MHSSRMRTVRSSGRISGGGSVPARGGTCLGGVPDPRGCTWSRGVYLILGGVPGPGGGVPGPGGCTCLGVYLVWGV